MRNAANQPWTGWRKSSRTQGGTLCVEVAVTRRRTLLVRDSKDLDGPVLAFTPTAWATFLRSLRDMP
ncbi:MAG TPA: DUF397 domain-containing protein [Streptosporangiaceae bacterium]|nr:DUF397 domain-containing protein [Streptosporangiaceae bacterium]